MRQFNMCDMIKRKRKILLRREDNFQSFDMLSVIYTLIYILSFFILSSIAGILYGRCVNSGVWGGGGVGFFENWKNWSLQDRSFSLLGQVNNNFLEKETCKLQLLARLLIQNLTHSYKSRFHQSKKTLTQCAPLIWLRPLVKKTPEISNFPPFFQESFLLEKSLCFLQMKQISMEQAQ